MLVAQHCSGGGDIRRLHVAGEIDQIVDGFLVTVPSCCGQQYIGGAAGPIAAVIARPELDVAGGVAFGHYTHEKNPLLCRAALTTIEIIEDEDLVENARVQGVRALERLHDMSARHPLIGNVRGLGLLMGIDPIDDRETRTPALEAGESILYRALGKGLSFKLTMGNVLTLTPPLTVTESEIDAALSILDECLSEEESARR